MTLSIEKQMLMMWAIFYNSDQLVIFFCPTSCEFVLTFKQGMTYPVLKVMWRAPASGFHCICVWTTKHPEVSRERFSLVSALNLSHIQMCYFLIGF